MLDDDDIEKLCRGRIIKASFYNSAGSNAAGPHYAVMMETDEEIRNNDSYYVVVISHKYHADVKFTLPVPAYTGLDGFIVCSWQDTANLAGITEICGKLLPSDMLAINRLMQEFNVWKANQRKRK